MITKLSGKFPSLMESDKCLMIGRLAGSFLLIFLFDLFDCVGKGRGVCLTNGRKGFQFD
jgi:hypothetical protein